jgi:hypothetical protein
MFNGLSAVPSKAVALMLILTAMLASCSQEPPEPPVIIFPTLPNFAVPAYFYMNGKTPSVYDAGRTGFMVASMSNTRNLLVVSDDAGVTAADHPVVYFYGIEGMTSVEIHFAANADFPSRLVIHQQGMSDTVGTFSAYNTIAETFSITINYESGPETYDLALNKDVFTAHSGSDDLNPTQKRRLRNIFTSIALWAALIDQTEDAALAPPEMAALVGLPLPPVVNFGFGVVHGVLAEGFKVASVNVDNSASQGSQSPSVTINPGERGPAGGYLFATGRDDGTALEWFEAAPDEVRFCKIRDGDAAAACEAYSVTTPSDGEISGWFLPDFNQLNHIYALYREKKINCIPASYWSSTRVDNTGETPDTYYQIVRFDTGGPPYYDTDAFWYLVRPIRSLTIEEIIAFKNAGNG